MNVKVGTVINYIHALPVKISDAPSRASEIQTKLQKCATLFVKMNQFITSRFFLLVYVSFNLYYTFDCFFTHRFALLVLLNTKTTKAFYSVVPYCSVRNDKDK